ncbi:hypothetical protein TNCV_4629411 [Trichonephila clavipes]|nr:hypothetical protein TNCV_4629411 [Trichonephila clavipes]
MTSEMPPNQYGGYDPRFVTEWVRIPNFCFFISPIDKDEILSLKTLLNWDQTGSRSVSLTAVPKGSGLNLGEGMDVCKCMVPVGHWSTKYSASRKSSQAVSGKGRGREATSRALS